MAHRPYNVLFLCTGNSCRSILAETLLAHAGHGQFAAFSAGSFPTGVVHPGAIAVLQGLGLPTDGLRSKGWDEFALPSAPVMDFIFTVCDDAAGEVCPVWPGHPVTAHWGVLDPSRVEDPVARAHAFHQVLQELENRIQLFTSLPFATLDRLSLQAQVERIGRTRKTP